MIIKTVLKSGGEYKPDHVQRMASMIKRHVRCAYDFVCYSDIDFPLNGTIRRLKNDWPRYWPKLEMFCDIEDSFYIDLDMTINGDITDMVEYKTSFAALSNMTPRIQGIGSALMKWSGDKRFIYDTFIKSPADFMEKYKATGTPFLGDQGFLWDLLSDDAFERFQNLFPGRIRVFNDPAPADIKVYYGRNRPWK